MSLKKQKLKKDRFFDVFKQALLKYTQLPGKPRSRLKAAMLLASAKGQCSLLKVTFDRLLASRKVFCGGA